MLELAPQGTSLGNTIDTAPLSSVDSLINKFDSHHGGQIRGRTGRRTRTLPPEQRKRSQSLDNRLPRDTLQERERRSPDHWIPGTKHDLRTGSSKPSAQSSLAGFSRARQTQDWVLQSFEEPQGRAQDPAVLQVRLHPLWLTTPGPSSSVPTHQPWDPKWTQMIYSRVYILSFTL